MDGKALLSGLNLLSMPAPRVMSVLFALWLEWHSRDEDARKHQNKLIRLLAETAQPLPEVEDDGVGGNPFPGVMRGGAVGSI